MDEKRTVFERIAAVKAAVRAIPKEQENKYQKFKYRGIDDMYNHIGPIEGREGVFWTFDIAKHEITERVSKEGTKMLHHMATINYHVWGADGDRLPPPFVVIGEAMDSGDKGLNKCLAVAHKYAMIQLYAVPTADLIDPDSESPEINGTKPKPVKREKPTDTKPAEKPTIVPGIDRGESIPETPDPSEAEPVFVKYTRKQADKINELVAILKEEARWTKGTVMATLTQQCKIKGLDELSEELATTFIAYLERKVEETRKENEKLNEGIA